MKNTDQTPGATLPLPRAPRQWCTPLFTPVPLTRHEIEVIQRALKCAQTGGVAATREQREEYWLLDRTLNLHLEEASLGAHVRSNDPLHVTPKDQVADREDVGCLPVGVLKFYTGLAVGSGVLAEADSLDDNIGVAFGVSETDKEGFHGGSKAATPPPAPVEKTWVFRLRNGERHELPGTKIEGTLAFLHVYDQTGRHTATVCDCVFFGLKSAIVSEGRPA